MKGFKVIKYFVCIHTSTVNVIGYVRLAATAAATKGFSSIRNHNCT